MPDIYHTPVPLSHLLDMDNLGKIEKSMYHSAAKSNDSYKLFLKTAPCDASEPRQLGSTGQGVSTKSVSTNLELKLFLCRVLTTQKLM